MIDRRHFVAAGASLMIAAPAVLGAAPANPSARLATLEREAGVRLGACVFDTGSGTGFGWREDERFCHCSTFKLSLAAMALHEGDAGRLDLDEPLSFTRSDIIAWSPVIEENLSKGSLSIVALAEAAQIVSDNAAANVLMRRLGGPEALTRFWRGTGDSVSRIDGYEPEINLIPPGTEENSTTPRAMAETLRKIVLGDVLADGSRKRLADWMEATQSGKNRIRAGLPAGWRGLDKTGTGMRPGIGNKTNDIAVLLPPDGRAPLVVTGYVENATFSAETNPKDEAVLRQLGAIATDWAGG